MKYIYSEKEIKELIAKDFREKHPEYKTKDIFGGFKVRYSKWTNDRSIEFIITPDDQRT